MRMTIEIEIKHARIDPTPTEHNRQCDTDVRRQQSLIENTRTRVNLENCDTHKHIQYYTCMYYMATLQNIG